MIFSERIRLLRASRRLTQVQMAQALEISERQYQNLELAVSKPSYDNLLAIAEYFGVSIDYLVGRTENPEVNR